MFRTKAVLRPDLGVGRHVARTLSQGGAHEQEAFAIADHGLVGEVHERLGARLAQCGAHGVKELRHGLAARIYGVEPRKPELCREPWHGVFAAAQLLAAPGEQPGDDLVAAPQTIQRGGHHRRVVLAVDHHDGARQGRRYRPSS